MRRPTGADLAFWSSLPGVVYLRGHGTERWGPETLEFERFFPTGS